MRSCSVSEVNGLYLCTKALKNVSIDQTRKQKAHTWCSLCEVSSWSALCASCKAMSSDFSSQERKQVAIAELDFPLGA